MIIRRINESDLDQVLEIEKRSFSDPWSWNGFYHTIHETYTCCLAAIIDDSLAGYCIIYNLVETGEIVNIAVHAAYKSRGVASALLTAAMTDPELTTVQNYVLEVRKSNAPARKLYSKLGFMEAGLRKNFYEKPVEDAIIMTKTVEKVIP